ncbi:MAG: phosphatase PAP2 family protein, partial [Stellaceae bacterium]
TLHRLDLSKLEGLINLPSFHAGLAIFFVYAVRRRMALLAFAGALNGVMIVAVLTEGGHYLVDAISGAAVAGAAIAAAARIEAALARKPLRAEPRLAPDTPVRT